jgi:hypothetical protein
MFDELDFQLILLTLQIRIEKCADYLFWFRTQSIYLAQLTSQGD